jgi:2-polyprenyl-6-methoxyphenol hydroxylase-like FAD-dependent oxidoreductase
MATITVLGAGTNGLTTALLLARDGHEVTVLERDPAPPPRPGDAWEHWSRRGVAQFRMLHYLLARWRLEVQRALPDVLDDLAAAGGLRLNSITSLPEERRGPVRPGDEDFETLTARRPLLEAVLAAAAAREPGVTVRRGVPVDGLLTGRPTAPGVPHVAGVRTGDGGQFPADLVVDCRGRRCGVAGWLSAIGARAPLEEREELGFVYFGRHYRSRHGELPPPLAPLVQHYAPVTAVTLPADNGTWSVGLVTSSADHRLRVLRHPDAWQAALERLPLIAHWGSPAYGEPLTGIDVMAGLADRHRRLVVDGEPVVTGLVAVGDAWAATNPTLGRGISIGIVHARALQDLLREVDLADAEKVVRRFDEVTGATVEPLYRAVLDFDRHRLAELTGEITGVPYETDDRGWRRTKALGAAALTDPDALRLYARTALLLETPQQVFGDPAVAARLEAVAARAPRFPLPGPTRAELLGALGG